MAERAIDSAPKQDASTIAIAVACVAAAFVFVGAPGLQTVLAAAGLPSFPGPQYWPMGLHMLATAGALAGGVWITSVLRAVARPGLLPLAAFGVFQFTVLAAALMNIALAVNMIRFQSGGVWAGLALLVPAFAALRLHSEMYMALLRIRRWFMSIDSGSLPPLRGAALVALTVAVNLIPLALCFQSLTTHMAAVLSVLFRRAQIDPNWYFAAISGGISDVSRQELMLAGGAGVLAILLSGLWASGQFTQRRQQARASALAGDLSTADASFVEDALPATVHAIAQRASTQRHLFWAVLWYLVVTPALLVLAYWVYVAFDAILERNALAWVTQATSDFEVFAVTEQGIARFLIPAALAAIAVFMGRGTILTLSPDSRFDFVAFGMNAENEMRAALLRSTAAGETGAGRPFDPAAFVSAKIRPRTWPGAAIALTLGVAAGAAAVYDLGRSTVFTADGVIVQDGPFAAQQLTRYTMIQAVAIDCRMDALGAKPVYELTLPGARVVDMVAPTQLDQRLDQYLNVDRRLRFSGVGYAYPPGDLTPCLKAIEERYNPVIAAGTARLLHVLD